MSAVGVDVLNARSTVTVLVAWRRVIMKPFELMHTADGFASLSERLNGMDGETRIVMENTDRYYESFAMSVFHAGFFVPAVNPLAIKDYHEGISVRRVRTDKADDMKIAQFAIDKWGILPQYTPMDTIRYNLKTRHRQFQLSGKTKAALNNNLIVLPEQSCSGANRYFDSPVRPDGSQKGGISWTHYGKWTALLSSARAPLRSATGSGANAAAITFPSRKPLRSTRMPGRNSLWRPGTTPANCW